MITPNQADDYREHLERLLGSETFRNAPALCKLLSYLVEQTLAGRADSLKEFTIGVEAMGRRANYDPQTDPSVRVQVSRLRKRLTAYYKTDGLNDLIRLSLPKRHFVVEFAEAPGLRESFAPRVATATSGIFWRRMSYGLGICVVLLAAAMLRDVGARPGLDGGISVGPEFSPEMREFWGPYLESDAPTVLSLGVAAFIRVPGEPTTFLRQSTINDWPPQSEVRGLASLRDAISGTTPPHVVYSFCGVGEALGAYALGRSLGAAGLDIQVVRSPFWSWDHAKPTNLIFVGPPKFNRHISAGHFERGFRVVNGGVENPNALPGESTFFGEEELDGRPVTAHAVISRFPNGAGTGVVTIFSSNDGSGTWAAVEQLARPELARDLVSRIRRPDGRIPEAFEVVIRARFDKDYPVEMSYVTHRTYTAEDLAQSRPAGAAKPDGLAQSKVVHQ